MNPFIFWRWNRNLGDCLNMTFYYLAWTMFNQNTIYNDYFFADTFRNVELQSLLLVLNFLWGVKLPRSNYDFNLESAFIFLLGNEIEFQNVEMLFCIWTLTEVRLGIRLGNRLGYLRLGYLRLGYLRLGYLRLGKSL